MEFLLFMFSIIAFIGAIFYIAERTSDYDATDDLKNKKRSKLYLYIDYGTGCHYIKGGSGSLIPRLDADGNHVNEYKVPRVEV